MLICGAVIESNITTGGADNQFITVWQENGVGDPGLKSPLLTGGVTLIICNGIVFLHIVKTRLPYIDYSFLKRNKKFIFKTI
jgi:hypothetical protein